MKAWLAGFAIFLAALPFVPLMAQNKPTVAIIGTGTLAGTLGPALGKAGYRVIYGSREPARESVRTLVQRTGLKASAVGQREAAAQAQVVVLAVPGEVVQEVVRNLGELAGKIIVDVSGGEKRVAADGYLELASDSARAERIQAANPGLRVVRINLPSMFFFVNPELLGTRATALIASNVPAARETAATMMFDLGLDPWDAGPLRFARVFDALNVMNLIPAQQGRRESYELKMLPSVPLSCFADESEMFGFGQPAELKQLPKFPRRDTPSSCEEWMRRIGMPGPG